MATLTAEGGGTDGPATALHVDPQLGGRLTSWRVGGRELLLAGRPDMPPTFGGCYVMVPWAGRIRNGRFSWRGRTIELERDDAPHALHGVAYRRPWLLEEVAADRAVLTFDLDTAVVRDAGWPFGGLVRHEIRLTADTLDLRLTLTATTQDLPATMGWHPWFRRRGVGPQQAVVQAEAVGAYERDGPLPTGRIVASVPRPWDDCLRLQGTPAVVWPGTGRVEVAMDTPVAVIFEQHPEGVCIEPQTGPPDAVNLPEGPPVVAAGERMGVRTTFRWVADGA